MEPTKLATCDKIHTHERDEPAEMMTWMMWAKEMQVTHTQHRCPVCSRYKVWLPRVATDSNGILSELAARPAS